MAFSDMQREDVHESRYSGTLEANEVRELIGKAILDEFNLRYQPKDSIRLSLVGRDDLTVRYYLVVDHDWFTKPSPREDTAEIAAD